MMRRLLNLKGESGFTLIELMVVGIVIALVVIAIPVSFRGGTQVWEKGNQHGEWLQNALVGMEDMTREIRQSKGLVNLSSGSIEFKDKSDTNVIYQKDNDYLKRGPSGALQELAKPLDSLTLTGYGIDSSGNQVVTTDLDLIRSVNIRTDTYGADGKINLIPLAAYVQLRDRDIIEGEAEDFAIFGSLGVYMKNNNYVLGNVGCNGFYDPGNPEEGGIYLRQNSVIDGDIYYFPEDGLDYQGSGNVVHGDTQYNMYTELPCPTDFIPFSYGADETVPMNGTRILAPSTSAYRDLIIGNKGTVVFSTGQYYFRSIHAAGSVTFSYDFTLAGTVEIFVQEDVYIGNNLETTVADPAGASIALAAQKIYFETHHSNPDLDSPAFILKKADDPLHPWLGTIYAVYDDIGFVTGAGGGEGLNDVIVYGSLYSGITIDGVTTIDGTLMDDPAIANGTIYGGHVYMETNCYVYYEPSEYFQSLPYGCVLE